MYVGGDGSGYKGFCKRDLEEDLRAYLCELALVFEYKAPPTQIDPLLVSTSTSIPDLYPLHLQRLLGVVNVRGRSTSLLPPS